MNTQVEMIADPIELALTEQSLALAKLRNRWNGIKEFYAPIVNALGRAGVEPKLTDTMDVAFTGDAHKLAQVVRILRTAGFTTTAERPKQGETGWSAFYSHPGIETRTWLYFTSSVCRRVKVGTKMVEQDIYEVQCRDTSAEVAEPRQLPEAVPAPSVEFADDLPF